jgi:hypothetical protein
VLEQQGQRRHHRVLAQHQPPVVEDVEALADQRGGAAEHGEPGGDVGEQADPLAGLRAAKDDPGRLLEDLDAVDRRGPPAGPQQSGGVSRGSDSRPRRRGGAAGIAAGDGSGSSAAL